MNEWISYYALFTGCKPQSANYIHIIIRFQHQCSGCKRSRPPFPLIGPLLMTLNWRPRAQVTPLCACNVTHRHTDDVSQTEKGKMLVFVRAYRLPLLYSGVSRGKFREAGRGLGRDKTGRRRSEGTLEFGWTGGGEHERGPVRCAWSWTCCRIFQCLHTGWKWLGSKQPVLECRWEETTEGLGPRLFSWISSWLHRLKLLRTSKKNSLYFIQCVSGIVYKAPDRANQTLINLLRIAFKWSSWA